MKTMKFIFSSLFSNETIINESKHKPWWLAILLMILSCIISVCPTLISVMNTQGSTIITATQNYGIDYGLKSFSLDYLSVPGNKITIANEKLTVSSTAEMTKQKDYYLLTEIVHEDIVSLAVYYVNFTGEDQEKYKDFNDKMSVCINQIKISHPIENEPNTCILNSFLILGEETVYLLLCGKNAKCTYSTEADGTIKISGETNVGGGISGNYKYIKDQLCDLNSYAYGSNDAEKANNAIKSWKSFFDESYKSPRNLLALRYFGSFIGIDFVIVLSMGLLVFLFSKSKTSIRKFKFLEALKIVFFSTVSPAIISVVLGLMIPSFQSMAFVMLLVLRMTWLSMKATNPNNNQAVRK